MLRALRHSLLVAALGAAPAVAQSGKGCLPPVWFREGTLPHKPTELLGIGRDADVPRARAEARRDMARRLVKERGREILSWPSVRGKLNLKVYAEAEVARALTVAIAARLPDGRRLKVEPACNKLHVATTLDRRETLAMLRDSADLGEDAAQALAGKGDKLEEARRERETRRVTPLFASAERTVERLLKAAETASEADLLESLLRTPLEKRAESLALEVNAVKSMAWDEDRDAAVARVNEVALRHEKLITAFRTYKARDYAGAADTFRAIAVGGDEWAQLAMGILHAEARGVRRDHAEATRWLKKAIEQGNAPARAMLGAFHLSGHGTAASTAEGCKWLQSAAEAGWACELTVKSCRRP